MFVFVGWVECVPIGRKHKIYDTPSYAIARALARLRRAMDTSESVDAQGPHQASLLKTWYFEADKTRQALVATLAQHRNDVGRLSTQTVTDSLTGLMNHRALALRFEELMAVGAHFAVIALDLDYLKRINDVFGHPVGDKVLIAMTKTLWDSVRQQDSPFRLGGEEFIVIVPVASVHAALRAVERIRADVERAEMPNGVGQLTVSMGVALWPLHGKSLRTVVKCADRILYASKAAGRNRVTLLGEKSPIAEASKQKRKTACGRECTKS